MPIVTESHSTEVDRIETFPCDAYNLISMEGEIKQVSGNSKLQLLVSGRKYSKSIQISNNSVSHTNTHIICTLDNISCK